MMISRQLKQRVLLFCLLYILVAVLPLYAAQQDTTGRLVSYELVKTYSSGELNQLLFTGLQSKNAELVRGQIESLPRVKHEVDAYRVEYTTNNYDGSIITATGMVLMPDIEKGALPLLVYMHGTVFERYKCPSYIDDCGETQAAAAIFAAHSYIVAMPDYVGQGGSRVMHPYFHANTEASAGRDIIRAVRELCQKTGSEMNTRIFITGYSQGGHAAMALHRLLERDHANEFTVTASAPLAGAYDLFMCWKEWVDNPCDISSAVVAWTVISYNTIYGLYPTLTAVFMPPFQDTAPVLLDGDHKGIDIVTGLPKKPVDMLQKDFVTAIHDDSSPLYKRMQENNVYDWCPKAPVKLYHAPKDDIVPFQESTFTCNHMKNLGAKVSVVALDDVNSHRTSLLPALLSMKKWFDTMR